MENLDTILLAVFCFLMGAALVGLVVYIRMGGSKPPSTPETPADPDLVEVARLLRSHKTNRLVVGIDGKNHPSVNDLNAGQNQRMVSAAKVLQTWLNQPIQPEEPAPVPLAPLYTASIPPESTSPSPFSPESTSPSPFPPESTSPSPFPPESTSTSPISPESISPEPISPAPSAFIPTDDEPYLPPQPVPTVKTPPMAIPDPGSEFKPIAPRPLDAFSRILVGGTSQAAIQFKSIPEEINEILRARLPGSSFESLDLVLKEVPGQGVVVNVGLEQYSSVDAVPDPAVRDFIKQAIAVWEAKMRGEE